MFVDRHRPDPARLVVPRAGTVVPGSEMQYVLQCRRDDETIKTRPSTVRGIVRFLAASGVTSLLEWPEAAWRQRFPTPGPKSTTQGALVIYARRRVEELAVGRGWDIEYLKVPKTCVTWADALQSAVPGEPVLARPDVR